jgi:hypothetical protein
MLPGTFAKLVNALDDAPDATPAQPLWALRQTFLANPAA